ncbi:hypothetical protein M501DRAFT_1061454 [Patellaria atrata CBS 101060]|uniref:PXA domain-containing protein n=1 Tax=Patellaria atrata CBS 101060 TaxID=1346257 RepID=A0A9P4S3B4_9PEZI|nr:hypothetical protein M501DRAFT_1061454 [Patellaria atrata CBS 101060]
MTQNTPRNSNLHPRSKIPTITPTPSKAPEISRAPSRQSDRAKQEAEATSDRATAALIRRTLCAHHVPAAEKGGSAPQPIEELLPPLTSSNDVDLQLYGIIAVIFKVFVHTWYGKITPDHVFVEEVIQIIAHCTRALEQRLRKVDLESLLLDEIPELVDAHVTAYRIAHQSLHSHPLASAPREIYHSLHPHPALSPVPSDDDNTSVVEQQRNEATWRQLMVQAVLAVLLPTEDLENSCLRTLVGEVFAELILGNGIAGRACEGWLLWEAITRIVETVRPPLDDGNTMNKANENQSSQSVSRLEQYGLLSSSREDVEKPIKPGNGNGHDHEKWSASKLLWAILQYAFLAYTAVRAAIIILATSSSLPSRSHAGVVTDGHAAQTSPSSATYQPNVLIRVAEKRAIVSMRIWSCTAHLLEIDVRMPWLSGMMSLLHWGAISGPGKVGGTDGVLDRLLSHQLNRTLLNPAHIPPALRSLRATLFPANGLAPPRTPPDATEIQEIKQRCAAVIKAAIPESVMAVYFASKDERVVLGEIEGWLDVLGDSYLNRHLVFPIVELIVVRLMPEVAEKGVCELMEERLGEGLV